MIAILLASLGVPADRLQMAASMNTDAHFRPGRGKHQRADTSQGFRLGDRTSVGIDVPETTPATDPTDAGASVIVYFVAEPGPYAPPCVAASISGSVQCSA